MMSANACAHLQSPVAWRYGMSEKLLHHAAILQTGNAQRVRQRWTCSS